MSATPVYRVGSREVRVLSDGVIWLDAGAVFGLVPKVMWQRVTGETNELNQIPLALNCLLLESDGKTVLIETGQGNKDFEQTRRRGWEPDHGKLIDDLARNGVRPADVDIVINTHLHNDHTGWNTIENGEGELAVTFPNARYYIQRGEWEDAMHPNERTRATYLPENLLPVEAAGQIEFIEGETQVTSDITVIETPGHTAEHASVVIANGGESAVYLGDMIQHQVQLERAAWLSAFDVLPLVNLETKKRVVADAIKNRSLLVAVHNPFPGVGRMSAGERGRNVWTSEAPHAVANTETAASRG
ncbi:MAG: MBL fold metallo-hydrolase [Chloroflexi bacterium]|nr:MBL fold metallo-hydrolase [Chloroflexota bacterium]MCY3696901.1 MBL fold metallo-hydrolase [Chloroflexota bacterium]